jgi:PAS domain S-box-containing protein
VGADEHDEDRQLRAAALKNIESIRIARQRAERELLAAKEALERKTQELQQQREWFEVTLSSIGDAVITADTAGRVSYLNPAAESMTGWELTEARGVPLEQVFRIVNEITHAPAQSPVNKVLQTGKVIGLANHTALIAKNGTVISIEDSAAPIRDANGQVTGIVMVFHDVTQRRRAEREVRETAERLQLALAAGNLGDWSWDAHTDALTLGARAAQIFGLPPHAPITWTQMRERLLVESDGERARIAVEQALAERSDYNIEYQVARPSGEQCWVAARGRGLYADNGATLGMIGVVQDITERKHAEAIRSRLAAVVESSDDAIISKTLEGIVTTWNLGAQRMFGYTAEEVIGKSVTLLFPPDHIDEEPAILARLRRGERIEHYETIRRRKDGTLIDVSLTVSPIKDHTGHIIGASKIARDITQHKRAEQALREADRRKDEFLATLAHELRNPLAPIRQAALISKAPTATEAQKRWSHDVISRQVHHMALLLDDLLDISRITRGTLQLRMQMTELTAVVDAAVETARPVIEAKRHVFSIEMPPPPVHLLADPLRLAQVLSNLLTNAAKYTDPQGEISLRVTCDAEAVTISVTDTGIGIAPDAIDRVFVMFSQIKSGQDHSEDGLGIGLALAKGLVELHGGTIEARSPGTRQGSQFTVHLPRRTLATERQQTEQPSAAKSAVRRRVLIADDNQDAAQSLEMLLQMEGHEVTIVHDGKEALAAFNRLQPEVVLLDIGMPELNGYDVARQIRQSPGGKNVMLIAVTGWGQNSDKAQARMAGFDHHFTKPINTERLGELLYGGPNSSADSRESPRPR